MRSIYCPFSANSALLHGWVKCSEIVMLSGFSASSRSSIVATKILNKYVLLSSSSISYTLFDRATRARSALLTKRTSPVYSSKSPISFCT